MGGRARGRVRGDWRGDSCVGLSLLISHYSKMRYIRS
jgi:hypothetical protein